jgi:hypothetical protein
MILTIILLLAPIPQPAVYLDPGSGSFLIQLLLGGLVGLILIVKTFWGRIKLFFANLIGKNPAVNEETIPEEHGD